MRKTFKTKRGILAMVGIALALVLVVGATMVRPTNLPVQEEEGENMKQEAQGEREVIMVEVVDEAPIPLAYTNGGVLDSNAQGAVDNSPSVVGGARLPE